MKFKKLFPVLTFVFFLSTCFLLFQNYFFPKKQDQSQQFSETELKDQIFSKNTSSLKSQISDEEILRLIDIENEQKELVLLFERVSADLKDANDSKQILNELLLGRSTLRDFGNRFIEFKLFKKSGGFLNYVRKKTKKFLNDSSLGVNLSGIKRKDITIFRKEITTWLVSKSNEEIEALARFVSFFYAETLYDIPMTILASRMIPELEEINFGTPVLLENVLTTPSRDANGEMNEKKPTTVEKYSMVQQFFFRRGPKISKKAVVFLKAYLSYTDL